MSAPARHALRTAISQWFHRVETAGRYLWLGGSGGPPKSQVPIPVDHEDVFPLRGNHVTSPKDIAPLKGSQIQIVRSKVRGTSRRDLRRWQKIPVDAHAAHKVESEVR